MSLCRCYVRELRKSVTADDDGYIGKASSSLLSQLMTDTGAAAQDEEKRTVGRADIRASAEKILYTYLLSGSEREILLPAGITADVITNIEDYGRDDPEVFDAVEGYVFEAMERDAFPGFMKMGRSLWRGVRYPMGLGSLLSGRYMIVEDAEGEEVERGRSSKDNSGIVR
jgi:hypothetical protein